ncbi:MAG: PDZ domain-containing protein [Planctomycetota bacterium]
MSRLLLLLLPGCAFLAPKINKTPPALYDMEEPLALHQEPEDELQRRDLPAGSFTGVYVKAAAESLEDLGEEPDGVLVDRVVENSPGQFAGLEKGDLILEANGKPVQYESEWRKLELESKPQTRIEVLYDRAGSERACTVVTAERAAPADRKAAQRFREEDRVGIVVRTATEVEARAAGLGPGGGAVVVGMAQTSPWRKAGLRYGDLIIESGGTPIDHPNVLLQAIRDAPNKGSVKLVFVRDGARMEIDGAVSRRAQEQQIAQVPLLYYFERDRDQRKFWVFFGIYKRVVTAAARETTILWFFKFRSGDSDRLEEVKE